MYEHRNAYLHQCGEVEGFVGFGSTKAKALADAIDQIKRKIDILTSDGDEEALFNKARIIESPSRLSKEQLEIVQKDWRCRLCY